MGGRPRAKSEEMVWTKVEGISKAGAQACKICKGQCIQVFQKAYSEQEWLGLDGASFSHNKKKAKSVIQL